MLRTALVIFIVVSFVFISGAVLIAHKVDGATASILAIGLVGGFRVVMGRWF